MLKWQAGLFGSCFAALTSAEARLAAHAPRRVLELALPHQTRRGTQPRGVSYKATNTVSLESCSTTQNAALKTSQRNKAQQNREPGVTRGRRERDTRDMRRAPTRDGHEAERYMRPATCVASQRSFGCGGLGLEEQQTGGGGRPCCGPSCLPSA
jgi:hypothetical protein